MFLGRIRGVDRLTGGGFPRRDHARSLLDRRWFRMLLRTVAKSREATIDIVGLFHALRCNCRKNDYFFDSSRRQTHCLPTRLTGLAPIALAARPWLRTCHDEGA